jgi:hypothetical protein
MTRETVEKLPQEIRNRIEQFRQDAKKDAARRELYINKGRGYVEGLRDAGMIKEYESRILKCYLTI